MQQNNTPLRCISPLLWEEGEWEDSKKIIKSISFSIEDILLQNGKIDFKALIRFLEGETEWVYTPFNEELIEKIFFPFFDDMKQKYFSENISFPENILSILRDHSTVRNAIIAYIEKRNNQIKPHIDQYDSIDFHLFLLWMNQDFDLVKDIHIDYFKNINTLFADSTAKVLKIIGNIPGWTSRNLPEQLAQELNYCMQLGETINKLALIHTGNFEEVRYLSNLVWLFERILITWDDSFIRKSLKITSYEKNWVIFPERFRGILPIELWLEELFPR